MFLFCHILANLILDSLIIHRSFKDGRYYTVSKKDTNRFHKEAAKRSDKEHLRDGKIYFHLQFDSLKQAWATSAREHF